MEPPHIHYAPAAGVCGVDPLHRDQAALLPLERFAHLRKTSGSVVVYEIVGQNDPRRARRPPQAGAQSTAWPSPRASGWRMDRQLTPEGSISRNWRA